mgnify:CR=1 FL=1
MTTQTLVMDEKREVIYAMVRDVLVDALGVGREEVTPNATLRGCLGAESIDYLDINFRLEKAFAIKIPRGDLFPDLDNEFYDDIGVINPDGIAYLRLNYPYIPVGADERSLNLDELTGRISVNSLVDYVEKQLRKS